MRKTAVVIFTLILILSYIPTAQAAGGTGYSATASSNAVYVGQSIHLTLTTPATAASVKLYLDGKRQDTAVAMSQESATSKVWTADMILTKAGTHKARFYVYGNNGKLLARCPSSYIKIRVTLQVLPPTTEDALVMEYDTAVLKGTLPPPNGVKYRTLGFCLGTSQSNMNKKISANPSKGTTYNKLASGLLPATTYYCQAYATSTTGVLVKGAVKSFTTPAKTIWTVEDSLKATSDEKYDYLFHSQDRYYTIDNPPLGYQTRAEASKQMATISVPVWKISKGKRVASAMPITVNRKLAENVKAVFNEIYALDVHFPICELKSFRYGKVTGPGAVRTSRIMSHHSYGAAIDINWSVNDFFLDGDKRDKKSPYCIPQEVNDIFTKYGWAWGGNFACGQDTMHFQYLGIELLPEKLTVDN